VTGFKIYRGRRNDASCAINSGQLLSSTTIRYIDQDVTPGTQYRYRIGVVLDDGSEITSNEIAVTAPEVQTVLYQNSPNPFNPATTIAFTLAKRSWVRIDVFNIEGIRIATPLNEMRDGGYHKAMWNGTNVQGHSVTSGVYFFRLSTNGATLTKKMILLK
jgi:hypothetical protein